MTEETVYSWTEVSKHNDDKSLWLVIHGKVYDVSKYGLEHPGGLAILLEHAGIDATDDFEDVGHSSDALEIMAKMKIGVIEPTVKKEECGCQWKRKLILVPVAVAAVAAAIFYTVLPVLDCLYEKSLLGIKDRE